jgi:hypothetical protein
MSESLGISVTNGCYQCYMLDDACMDCEDTRTARDTNIAHAIVDEGNLQYSKQLSYNLPESSGHDWVSSTTLGTWYDPETQREEFLEPITVITDRLFDLSFDMPANSVICQDCHYTYNKHTQCPNCN